MTKKETDAWDALYEATLTPERPEGWLTITDLCERFNMSRDRCRIWVNREVKNGTMLTEKYLVPDVTGRPQKHNCYKPAD